MQLQFWSPSKRSYIRSDAEATPENARELAMGRGWRICDPERPLKPAQPFLTRQSSSDRSVKEVQRQYLRWAQISKLDRITMFRERVAPNWEEKATFQRYAHGEHAPIFTGAVNYVAVADYFAVAHAEEDAQGAAANALATT